MELNDIYLLLGGVILLWILYIYWYSEWYNRPCIFPSIEYRYSLATSKHVRTYLNEIPQTTYSFKVPNYDPRTSTYPFLGEYMKMLKPVDEKYHDFLNRCFSKIYKEYMNEYNVPTRYWKCMMSEDGFEMNMPFTLHDVIVLPKKKLEFHSRQSYISISWLTTLIHEMIHIAQRENPSIVYTWTRHNLPFIRNITSAEYLLFQRMTYMDYMTNPDSNHQLVTYEIDNRVSYIPYLRVVKNSRAMSSQVEEYAMSTETGSKVDLETGIYPILNNKVFPLHDYYRRSKEENIHISWYHPNEIQACVLADDIIHKRKWRLEEDTLLNTQSIQKLFRV